MAGNCPYCQFSLPVFETTTSWLLPLSVCIPEIKLRGDTLISCSSRGAICFPRHSAHHIYCISVLMEQILKSHCYSSSIVTVISHRRYVVDDQDGKLTLDWDNQTWSMDLLPIGWAISYSFIFGTLPVCITSIREIFTVTECISPACWIFFILLPH